MLNSLNEVKASTIRYWLIISLPKMTETAGNLKRQVETTILLAVYKADCYVVVRRKRTNVLAVWCKYTFMRTFRNLTVKLSFVKAISIS